MKHTAFHISYPRYDNFFPKFVWPAPLASVNKIKCIDESFSVSIILFQAKNVHTRYTLSLEMITDSRCKCSVFGFNRTQLFSNITRKPRFFAFLNISKIFPWFVQIIDIFMNDLFSLIKTKQQFSSVSIEFPIDYLTPCNLLVVLVILSPYYPVFPTGYINACCSRYVF